MSFPYSAPQIADVVATPKNPRDWEPLEFEKSGENSQTCDVQLERGDGLPHRLRLIVSAGVASDPLTFKASLLLEDTRIRGIDYHAVERRRFYKEDIPKGWHEDVIDPNHDMAHKHYHVRQPLADLAPFDLADFTRKVCTHWNIELPGQMETLL